MAVSHGLVIFYMRVHVILLCFDDDKVYAYVQVCGYLAFLGLLTQSAQGVMNCKQLMYV